ncbi:MAG: FecR domain-containing protein [Deltaproteobacteria bacterium]|nr:FecR domain-containing protein [Deltaproteobacteria bacterium]MBW2360959.1 FecR domain-containing protein [Deltaproteobacteria bacterium]
MMWKPSIKPTHGALAIGLVALLLLPAGLAAAATAGRVTAAVGDAQADDAALALRGSLEDGAALETGEDGGCSILIDDDALMEVCGRTVLKLERKDGQPDGARVVRLERGAIRMVVEPRLGEEKVEIHTPAAIATVLGTILHASVNALGIAEIASEANRVQIQSTNPAHTEVKILEPGQSITIAVDGTLGDVVDLDPQEFQARGGCYVGLHGVSFAADRGRASDSKIAELVGNDVTTAELPPVAGAPGGGNVDLPSPPDPPPPPPPPEVGNESGAQESLPDPPDPEPPDPSFPPEDPSFPQG